MAVRFGVIFITDNYTNGRTSEITCDKKGTYSLSY